MTQTQTNVLTLIDAPNMGVLTERLTFATLLLNHRGAAPITFISHTSPRMRKTNNPHMDAVKVGRINGMVNFHYDEGVKRRLAKEGKDESEFKQGGSFHVPVFTEDGKVTPIAIHKEDAASVVGWDSKDGNRPKQDNGKDVALKDCKVNQFHVSDLTTFVNDNNGGIPRLYLRFMYKQGETQYVDSNGVRIDEKELEPFLSERSDYSNQGLDKPLVFLTYGLDSLQQATFDGQTFKLH